MRQLLIAAATAALTVTVNLPSSANPNTHNSSTEKPRVYLVADAHLDTQWEWDIQTTISKYVWNTLNQNLTLLQKYPEYVFNFEGGVKYAWMKEYFPHEYESIKPYIKSGRWHISGASWDATDAIVPSVESAIRNILLGQEYFRQEFGVESTDIFLPDCFGFGWTLPTIASHCGLIGFSSQKLAWRINPFYDGNRRYPFPVGVWKGIDGSEVMFAHGYGYGTRWDNGDLTANQDIKTRLKESPINVLYHYYGTGDRGGSPTIQSVESVAKACKTNGEITIISATSDSMFKDFMPLSKHPELPRFDGELLMDEHGTGCYTSQAAMKLYNRQNELLGDAAERAATAAELLHVGTYPSKELTEAWQRVIFHQFHDDLTGTSIPRAYEFSWNDELLSLKQFSSAITTAVNGVSQLMDTRTKGTPVIMYNPLGFNSTDVIELILPSKHTPARAEVIAPDGAKAPAQIVSHDSDGNVKILAQVSVAANGMAVYDVRLKGRADSNVTPHNANIIENSIYRIELNNSGDIISLIDKRHDKELVKDGKSIRLALFTDNESNPWPAWEIEKVVIDSNPISITENASMQIIEDGALRKVLRVTKEYDKSHFTQDIILYEGALAERIDIRNEIDWATANALLKAEFPLSVSNQMTTYDLGLGTVQRGVNTPTAYEVPAQYWADLTDSSNSYGVTVINDSKYGWDKPDANTMRLTLLHTPRTNHGFYKYQITQDMGHHEFTYSIIGHAGALDTPATRLKAETLNQRIKPFVAPKHEGTLGKEYSLASIDNDELLIKAIKKAESSDYYIIRLYDGAGKEQTGTMTFAADIAEAYEADGTEKTLRQASFNGNKLNVQTPKNGIATYKVKFDNKPKQLSATQRFESIDLNYDRKCFTWNHFTTEGYFSEAYSYAAELVPDIITSAGVPFRMENKKIANGMSCQGDTLKIPTNQAFNRVYLLAASAIEEGTITASIRSGKSVTEISVPSYTGFIGQWGHAGHTEGYLYDAEVAWVGTHRHSPQGDEPYEFTYMYLIPVDIPEGAGEIILPDNDKVIIFSATAAVEKHTRIESAAPMFRTANSDNKLTSADVNKENLLRPEHITGWSGYTNNEEKPCFMIDGDLDTKWCDTSGKPCYVEFDLGQPEAFSSWKIVNAAIEDKEMVSGAWLIQTRNDANDEWVTSDIVTCNSKNVVTRKYDNPLTARYVRLYIIQPMQNPDETIARVYEFGIYR